MHRTWHIDGSNGARAAVGARATLHLAEYTAATAYLERLQPEQERRRLSGVR